MPSRGDVTDVKDLARWIGNARVTSAAGAATLHANSGVITTEALTTAADTTYTLTLTNQKAKTTDMFQATLARGTLTAGDLLS